MAVWMVIACPLRAAGVMSASRRSWPLKIHYVMHYI